MRKSSYAIAVFAIAAAMAPAAYGQIDSSKLTITGYQLLSEQRLTRTQSYFTYRADVVNTGSALAAITATVMPLSSSGIQVVSGKGNLHFTNVAMNARVTSDNAFTILVDQTVSFSFNQLQWSFNSPVASAGPNQTSSVGATVALNASRSSNPSGIGTLSYSWALTAVPAGSQAALRSATGMTTSFAPDLSGDYVATVTVTNGAGSDSASVTISVNGNTAPVANAGPDQTVKAGSTVFLDGSKSSDVDGNPLTSSWSFVQVPSGSQAVLNGANTVSPTFIADVAGSYIVQLVVNDGQVNSAPDMVTITVTPGNSAPTANAGASQNVSAGATVQLDGSKSTDVDGDALTYKWSLITVPAGSKAVLSSPVIVNPVFTADLAGIYVAQLIVNDGKIDSQPATVNITASGGILAPTANPGPEQTVQYGATVTLSGSGTDPQSLPLTYKWSLITLPTGSQAALSNANSANPTFVADQPGTFVAQLIVNNGTLDSVPATVSITTTIASPVANPGQAQTVAIGAIVSLDGSGSSDPSNLSLAWKWSLTSAPAGSAAVLSSGNTAKTSFVADVAGAYVVQLIVNNGFRDSSPQTVTITASAANEITLSPDPLNLVNSSGTLTVTIGTPAGPGGQAVTLTVSDPTKVKAPATVTVPQNQTSVTASIAPAALGSTTILASAPGYRPASVTVNVNPGTLTLSLSGSTVGVTKTVTGTVSLSAPAPGQGVTVNLAASDTGVVSLPASINIASGQQTGTFTITGSSAGQVTIMATATGFGNDSQKLLVSPLGAIVLHSGLTVGTGQTVPLGVTLATPAPPGGATITLTSADTTKVTVTPTVFIREGATSPDAAAQVTGAGVGSVLITASSAGFTGDSRTVQVSAALTFTPQALTLSTNSSQNVTIALSGTAPQGGLVVNLSSDNTSSANVPNTVTIAQNTSSVMVPVTGINAGSANITATAAASGILAASLKVNVVSGVAITSTSLPAGVAGAPYSASLAATGGTQPYTFSALGLPNGLSISGAGQISGTPQSPGTSQVVITVTDSTGGAKLTAAVTLSLNVNPTLSITTTALPVGALNAAYNFSVTANGGTPPYSFAASGLPTGLSMNASGQITGNPQAAGMSSVVITATDSTSPTRVTATATLSLAVSGPLSITTTSLPSGAVNNSYSAAVNASGGAQPYTFSAAGLPSGLTMSAAGQISGTPQSAGTSSVVVSVTDSTSPAKMSATATLQLTILQPFAITTTSLPAGAIKNPYNAAVAANGGTKPYSFSAAGLPNGLTMNAGGQISGTPLTAGTSMVTVTVTDSTSPAKLTATAQLSLTVRGAALAITTTSLPAGATGNGYTGGLQATGGTPPYHWAQTGGTLPAGLSFDQSSGAISGTPTLAGNYPLTFSVTDSAAPAQSATLSTSISISQGLVTGPALTLSGVTVGNGLETAIVINLSQAPASQLNITISSSNPGVAAIAEREADSGTGSLVLPVNPGTTSFAVYVQGLASSGSANITVSAPGYNSGSAPVNLAPSAFVIQGPNGFGGSFVTNQGQNTNLTISAAQLDSSGNVAQIQKVSGSSPATVNLNVANSGLGSIAPSSISFAGGNDSIPATFTAANSAGSTTISLSQPPGFTTPAGGGDTLTVTVQQTQILPSNATVGQGLETTARVVLQGAAPQDLPVTITSNDPSKLLLSSDPAAAGQASITLKINAGGSQTPPFYVYGLASSGSVTYSASAAGFGSANGTVTLAKAGFVVSGPLGNQDFPTYNQSAPSLIDVQSVILDASGNVAGQQAIAGGSSVAVTVTSQTTSVGTITASPVTLAPGTGDASTQFQPAANGSTVLSAVGPAPFVVPARGGSITATVGTANITVASDSVGKNLEHPISISVGAAPASDLTVTLTVTGRMLLSTTGTDGGSTSINVTIPANTYSGTFYMYGLDSTGTAAITASASGYASGTATENLTPSGVRIYVPYYPYNILQATAGTTQAVTIQTVQLDSTGNIVGSQPLAGNQTLTVSLSSSNPAAGTVPATASITGGNDTGTVPFTAKAAGTTTLAVTQASGYTAPNLYTSIQANVQ